MRIFSAVWGAKFIDWWYCACLRSLSWPRNAALLASAKQWDVYCDPSDEDDIQGVYAVSGHTVPLVLHNRKSALLHWCLKDHMRDCLRTNDSMLVAPPDTVWGEGSLESVLAIGSARGVCVSVPHVRVDADRWMFHIEPASNPVLVDAAFGCLHNTWQHADADLPSVNTWIGGVSWRKVGGLYLVQHLLPTYYYVNLVQSDLSKDFPGDWWDHSGWPEKVVDEQRQRTVCSSDAAFLVELTPPGANHPGVRPNDKGVPDRFIRDYSHNRINRSAVCVFRGVKG